MGSVLQITETEKELMGFFEKKSHHFAVIKFAEGDYIAVLESQATNGFTVKTISAVKGIEIPCVYVEPDKFEPFPEHGLVDSASCTPELACLASIVDLFFGTLHLF